jgi:hypothetical protein
MRHGSAATRSTCSGWPHHTVLMAALTRLPAVPCLPYGNAADLDRQLSQFILRGIGLTKPHCFSSGPRTVAELGTIGITAESA